VSKTNEHVLLVPGESGWEIWNRPSAAEGFSLLIASENEHALDLAGIPQGDLQMLFPVRSITAVPMKVASDDESLFADLAALHAERLGLRPDPMAGQLTDTFVIAREGENTALVSLFLKSPGDTDLPKRGPKGFDVSPRAWNVKGDALAIWKEFGRWVFAVYHDGRLVYCQATTVSSHSPDANLAREIRLSMLQLSIQGMDVEPDRILVWSDQQDISDKALAEISKARVEIARRPTPVLPDPPSKLLPADVRAARRTALKRRNITLAAAAVALIYLGIIGWFGFGLWKDMGETKKLLQQATAAAPEGEAYALHVAKWDELAQAIDLNQAPVDILYRISRSIPPNSGLRLRTAEISALEVKLIGEAQQAPAVNQFSLALTRNNDLAAFTWQTPEPSQSTRGWEFVFTGSTAQEP
jgi:hypothetical protein